MVDHLVTDIDADGVTMETERVRAGTIIWAAGVLASGLAGVLAAASGAETDAVGRHPGRARPDAARRIPRCSRSATWSRSAAPTRCRASRRWRCRWGATRPRPCASRLKGDELGPFKYKDKGNLATIGRARAVAELPPRIRVGGFLAWALWLGIHLFYLIGFQNRLLVLLRWALQLPHARARDAADHRRAEYALAVILDRSWRSSTS